VSPDRDFRRALEGGTPYRIEDTPPHLRAEGVSSQVLVVRAGVKGPKSGSVVGVVETARDYAGVSMSVRDSLLLIWIVVGLGAAVMAGILRYVAWSTEAELVRGGRRVASLNARLDIALGDLEDQSLGVLQALCEAVDAKDSYTAHHSLGVADIASRLGGQLGMTEGELAVVERAALLHDIGKIGVPEELLLKPTALEPDEFERVKEHSETGARIIGTLPFLTQVVPVVRHHHEHWDGTGYPLGLTGDDIPFAARILAVADAFDAMTTDRPYRKAIAATAALAEIRRCSGSQFDPEVVSAIGVMAEAGGLIARGDERGGE
jgi:putative nucleotidyltransferase with HDIG domain